MSHLDVATVKSYIELGKNALFVGKHGVGKTEIVQQAIAEMKHPDGTPYKLVKFSASTMDPWTDLAGVPIPVEENNERDLIQVRPKKIDQADVLFIDEFNRANDPKTINAFMEILQFHTINGEPLPRLKCILAAINPPDEGYEVLSLDLAILDRFQFTKHVDNTPDKSYFRAALTAKFGEEIGVRVADGLIEWHDKHDKNSGYISPRRLLETGITYIQASQKGYSAARIKEMIQDSMPPGDGWDWGRLYMLVGGDTAANPASTDFDFSEQEFKWIREKADADNLARWFSVSDDDKKHIVIDALRDGQPNKTIEKFGKVFNAFTNSDLSYFCEPLGRGRLEILKISINQSPAISDKNKESFEEVINGKIAAL